MRAKQSYVVITFHSTTDAMAMKRRCGELGIPGRLIPVPREISASCGLAWRMPDGDYLLYHQQIQKLGIEMQDCVPIDM